MNKLMTTFLLALALSAAAIAQDSLNVRRMAQIVVGTNAVAIELQGGYAYVAGGESGLRVVDVSNPVAPIEIGSCDTPGSMRELSLHGSYIVVADRPGGIRVIDVTNPHMPFEVGWLDTPGSAESIVISGNYGYLADGHAGLRILDISVPSAPIEVGAADTPGDGLGVAKEGNLALVADGNFGVRIFDVLNTEQPVQVGFYDTPGYSWNVAVQGSLAYVSDSHGGLRVLDISNPAIPFEVGFILLPCCSRKTIVVGDYAYVADAESGLRIVNIFNPATMYEVGYNVTPAPAIGLTVSGRYAYIGEIYHVGVYDCSAAVPVCPHTPLPFLDNFDSPELDSCWTWIHEDTTHRSLTDRPGWMRIVTQYGDVGSISANHQNALLRSRPAADFQVETQVAIDPTMNHHQGGLLLYLDDGNWMGLARAYSSPIAFHGETNGIWDLNLQPECSDTNVYLRIVVTDTTATAAWSIDGNSWVLVGTHSTAWLSDDAIRLGLYADNGLSPATDIPADFDYFSLREVPGITLLSPNGSEQWAIYSMDTVRWFADSIQGDIMIELNRDYPNGEWEILDTVTANDGSEAVEVTPPLSVDCRVRVSAVEDTFSDVSNGNFSITSSAGFLAMIRDAQPNTTVLAWNAATVECPLEIAETFRLKNFGNETIVVFRPQALAGPDFFRTTTIPVRDTLDPGEITAGIVTLTCDPANDGSHSDTLQIQTDASNATNGILNIPLTGTRVSTPAAPEIVINAQGNDAVLHWDPVSESTGECAVNVTGYLVFYSPMVGGPYYYHGFTTDTSYTHVRVIQFNYGMFYEITASTASLSVLLSLEPGQKREAVRHGHE